MPAGGCTGAVRLGETRAQNQCIGHIDGPAAAPTRPRPASDGRDHILVTWDLRWAHCRAARACSNVQGPVSSRVSCAPGNAAASRGIEAPKSSFPSLGRTSPGWPSCAQPSQTNPCAWMLSKHTPAWKAAGFSAKQSSRSPASAVQLRSTVTPAGTGVCLPGPQVRRTAPATAAASRTGCQSESLTGIPSTDRAILCT